MSKIFALLNVRNGEKWLPGYFSHLRDYVDGFLVLDDASTDKTKEIIQAEKKVRFSYFETELAPLFSKESENRFTLLNAAQQLGATWVLCADVDFRFETKFLEHLRTLIRFAEFKNTPVLGLKLRELWDSPDQFRIDGYWNTKVRYLFFKLPEVISLNPPVLHSSWVPENAGYSCSVLDYNVYHLEMIEEQDRINRIKKYKKIDKFGNNGGLGYDYLNDKRGLVVQKISKNHSFEID